MAIHLRRTQDSKVRSHIMFVASFVRGFPYRRQSIITMLTVTRIRQPILCRKAANAGTSSCVSTAPAPSLHILDYSNSLKADSATYSAGTLSYITQNIIRNPDLCFPATTIRLQFCSQTTSHHLLGFEAIFRSWDLSITSATIHSETYTL
jgi:hypothetical protein